MAIGAMRALRDQRLDVPRDLSVVGFDDLDLAPHTQPPLTTIHQPIRRKGEEAVRLLLVRRSTRDLTNLDHRLLETRLIVRGSTGPAPAQRQEVEETFTEVDPAKPVTGSRSRRRPGTGTRRPKRSTHPIATGRQAPH